MTLKWDTDFGGEKWSSYSDIIWKSMTSTLGAVWGWQVVQDTQEHSGHTENLVHMFYERHLPSCPLISEEPAACNWDRCLAETWPQNWLLRAMGVVQGWARDGKLDSRVLWTLSFDSTARHRTVKLWMLSKECDMWHMNTSRRYG